ncbi:Catalase / Peroxidase [Thioalkalivibrio nitratireducens DSM 14787]|uniref:Catalase / Peroxidase n=1 Tax=Thioalkalivibrio nitratireducens (strain DSM 14787 / UNIQEM 213 / ALEN2) TaxID=1255043 RepID=L0DY10_THIND|nr:Catalase / Peroxidase [Thioalkalivibrio nitratireducens DSM 14787]
MKVSSGRQGHSVERSVPAEDLTWQDPVPAVDHELIDARDIVSLKDRMLASELSVPDLVSTAWASASIFGGSDKRGRPTALRYFAPGGGPLV